MRRTPIQKIFRRIPELRTERLLLRKIRVSDAADMYSYSCLRSVTRYLLWNPHPDVEYTRRYVSYLQQKYRQGLYYDWAIVELKSGRMIGTCGFPTISEENCRAEVGYVLHPEFWGKGYATEALSAILSFAFRVLGLHRVEARCFEEHTASARVMEKCGMRYEGCARDGMLVKGSYATIRTFAVLAGEYPTVGE